jgi:hypothetical protein
MHSRGTYLLRFVLPLKRAHEFPPFLGLLIEHVFHLSRPSSLIRAHIHDFVSEHWFHEVLLRRDIQSMCEGQDSS